MIDAIVIDAANSSGSLSYLLVLGAALAATLALLAPGLALVQLLLARTSLAWPERLALAAGAAAALPALLLELARLAPIRWGASATWLYALCGLVGVIGSVALARRGAAVASIDTAPPASSNDSGHLDRRSLFSIPHFHGLLLLILWLAGLLVRLYAVRHLVAGLWGDSVHHTLITQLLVDNGGLFNSWQPYTPLVSFTYHFGFHANAAFLTWLTGWPTPQSTLLMGQILNAAAIPMAYVLTARFTRSATAGLWAAVLTGFVNWLPAYFVNWGRYTQLAAQVVLPAALVAWQELLDPLRAHPLEARPLNWGALAFTILMTAALALTHYIVTIFLALFVATYVAVLLLRASTWRAMLNPLLRSASAGLVAVLLALPWLINTAQGFLSRNTTALVSGYVSAERVASYAQLAPITPLYVKGYLLALAVLGAVLAARLLRWRALLFGLWSLLLIMTIVPNTFGLPGNGVVDYATGYMALYLTALPLAGFGIGALVDELVRAAPHWPALRWAPGVSAMALLAVAGWGLSWQGAIANPGFQLLTPADASAMRWIEQNTPAGARFWVNSYPAYGGTVIAGTDAGWWIPQLAHRATNLPPMLYGSERGESAVFAQTINSAAQNVRKLALSDSRPMQIDLTTPEALKVLRAQGITHIFIGANAMPGRAGADWIDPAPLQRSPHFKLIYDADGVKIFALILA